MFVNRIEALYIDFADNDFALFDGRNNLGQQRAVARAFVHLRPLEKLVIGQPLREFLFRYKVVQLITFAFTPRSRGGRTRKNEFRMIFFEHPQNHAFPDTAGTDKKYELAWRHADRVAKSEACFQRSFLLQ